MWLLLISAYFLHSKYCWQCNRRFFFFIRLGAYYVSFMLFKPLYLLCSSSCYEVALVMWIIDRKLKVPSVDIDNKKICERTNI